MTRTLQVYAVLLLCCTFSAQIHAAPTLLFSLNHVVPPPVFAIGLPPEALDYYFAVVNIGVGGDPARGLRWTTTASTVDVGTTYLASAEQVAELNSVLQGPLFLGAQIQTSDGSFSALFSSAIHDSPLHNGNATLQVDLYVPTLSVYRATSVERTIDSFYLQRIDFGHNVVYHFGGAQTLRVYGVLIPEPETAVFAIVAIITILCARTRPLVDNSVLRWNN